MLPDFRARKLSIPGIPRSLYVLFDCTDVILEHPLQEAEA